MVYYETEPERCRCIVDYTIHAPTAYDKIRKVNFLKVGSGFDIETSKIDLKNEEYTGYCYHWQMSFNKETIGGRSLDTMLYFFQWLIQRLKQLEKAPKLLIFDANLGYEFQYCKKYWQQLGMSDLFTKEKRNPLTLTLGEQLVFREAIGLFGHNLEQIAKYYSDVKKLKGDLDYNKVILSHTPMQPKEIQYCENDVQILSSLGNYVFNNYFGKKPSLPMTSTGIIRAKIKRRIGKNIRQVKEEVRANLPTEEIYQLFRKFLFKGGICGTNSVYTDRILTNVVCADYTSDYPACMNHYNFPMGKCEECGTDEFLKEKNIPYIALISFKNVMARTTHSLMSSHKCINLHDMLDGIVNSTIENGRIFRTDEMVLLLNDVEFKSFIKAYKFDTQTSMVLRCWKFEKYGKLPRYVLDVLNEEYIKKAELKESGNTESIEYKDSKASVNGIFGMMCTAIFMDEWDFEGSEIEIAGTKSFDEATKGMFLSPFWGFWITSYARSLLIDAITRYPDAVIQYDTDSIYFWDEHPDAPKLRDFIRTYNERMFKLNDAIFDNNPHFRDLGAWEVEKPFKRFKGLGSKRYAYQKENGTYSFVVSGCRKVKVKDGIVDYTSDDAVEISTIEFQHMHTGNGMDIFDFFSDGMHIDKNHSMKLSSTYVDEEHELDYADFNDNIEHIVCPSAVVLNPTEFTMGLAQAHIEFLRTVRGIYINSNREEKKAFGEIKIY